MFEQKQEPELEQAEMQTTSKRASELSKSVS
jgi:hypothetical protein